MSDLVERLRGPKNRTTSTSAGNWVMVARMGAYHHDDALHEQAAAEILRLRAQVAALLTCRDELAECVRQIEYLHEKFQKTGSGETVLSRAQSALSAYAAWEPPA